MKLLPFIVLVGLSACTSLETRPVKVTGVFPPGSVSLVAPQRGTTAAPTSAAAPPQPKAGQQWTYRRIDLWRNSETERFRQELAFEDRGRWIVRWTILDSEDARRRGSITGELFDPASHGYSDGRLSGAHVPLRFPLAPGKSWSFDYVVRSTTREVAVKQTAVVRDWEEIQTPAGRFQALRVEHDGRYVASEGGASWNGKIREIFWYAPAAGRIVMREYRDTKGDGGTWDQWRDELLEMRL